MALSRSQEPVTTPGFTLAELPPVGEMRISRKKLIKITWKM